MKQPTTLNRKQALPHSADYNKLKAEAIELLQQLSGDVWTDYNAHDPGITILEQLCYALTELGVKVNIGARQLRAAPDKPQKHKITHPLPEMLPLTLESYRIYLLDVFPQLANLWFETTPGYYGMNTRGLYKISLLTQRVLSDEEKLVLETELKDVYNSLRVLGEDLESIHFCQLKKLSLRARLDLNEHENPELEMARLITGLEKYLFPDVLRDHQGRVLTDRLTGPSPHKIKISDIKDLIWQYSSLVSDLELLVDDKIISESIDSVHPQTYFLLDIDEISRGETLQVIRSGLSTNINFGQFQKYYTELKYAHTASKIPKLSKQEESEGVSLKEIRYFHSIQNHFPEIYGVGPAGIPPQIAPDQRDSFGRSTTQLKGYLLLFDQLMANYLRQLAYLPYILSGAESEDSLPLNHLPEDVPGLENLISANYKKSIEGLPSHTIQEGKLKKRLLAMWGIKSNLAWLWEQHKQNIYWDYEKRSEAFLLTKLLEKAPDWHASRAKGVTWAGAGTKGGFIECLELILGWKLSTEKQLSNIGHIISEQTDQNSQQLSLALTLPELLSAGIHENQYYIRQEEDKYLLVLSMANQEDLTVFSTNTHQGAIATRDKLILRLRQIIKQGQGIHIVEHILLRPVPVEGWDLFYDFEENITFKAVILDEKQETALDIWAKGFAKAMEVDENIRIEERDAGFMLVLTLDDALFAHSSSYDSKGAAEKALTSLENLLKSLSPEDLINETEIYPYVPEGSGLSLDPYSDQISILIPQWLPEFASTESHALFRYILGELIPVHQYIRFHFLDLEEMKSMESLLSQWRRVFLLEPKDPLQLNRASFELLSALL